ncbi:ABC transporter ATP-binding protein [Ilyobacter sp.]|uniref:ABC transporter ATP-binding protein n=1 Tax=Ilyobacter sp. TaxID=3100343 RepID=UPI003563D611
MGDKILKIEDLKVYFPVKKGMLKKTVGYIKAVDGITFDVKPGETIGLVGESGCGKTSTGKALVRLSPIHDGKVYYYDKSLTELSENEFNSLRPDIQMIFQDPFSSLDPRMTVGEIIGEPLKFHRKDEDTTELVLKYMKLTGLREEFLKRYPHEFSGGQRQRIGIARALALEPKLIIADEPVSALDVSIQAQIINLMMELQKELNLSYIFIAHDLSVVKHISDRIVVMYLGNVMEISPSKKLYSEPFHPYTQSLISSIPIPDPRKRGKKEVLEGEIPSPLNSPVGCKFSTRCKYADDLCREKRPVLETVEGEHQIACHHWRKINKK